MKQIVEGFTAIIFLTLFAYAAIVIINAGSGAAAAKDYKADVIAEIENSNFNDNVIDACIAQADASGYKLQITNATFDQDNEIQTAEVILSYDYKMPLFGISVTKTTRGMAR